MIMGIAAFLPLIINNAMYAYDTANEKHKKDNNTLIDDENMRKRTIKPWDGSCNSVILPIDGTYTCNLPIRDYFCMEVNQYALKEESK